MSVVPTEDELGALSYVGLRRAIGIIALALPPTLVVGQLLLDGKPWPNSISAYYYTSMRNVFVGAMCALGVFLLSYRYRREDNRLSTVAAVCALGIALFPTAQEGTTTTGEDWVRAVHFGCAAVFFLVLAGFSLLVFTRTDGPLTSRKLLRNRVYRLCGVIIVVSLAAAGGNALWERSFDGYPLRDDNALFWLESIAVWAFGLSWLVKGNFLLADRAPTGRPDPVEAARHSGTGRRLC